MAKPTACKRCGEGPFHWVNVGTRWQLCGADGILHECAVREVKEVGCKYCSSNDLWWSKETMEDGSVKNVLMESFGLPHSCDERKKHFDAINQAKKDEYAKEKARISGIPDNSACGICVNGRVPGVTIGFSACPARCTACDGRGRITAKIKSRWLYEARQRIWPNMGKRDRR